jgi:hypothetical protein
MMPDALHWLGITKIDKVPGNHMLKLMMACYSSQ